MTINNTQTAITEILKCTKTITVKHGKHEAVRRLKPASTLVIVVGTNLCVRRLLEVKDKGIRGMEGVADKEACIIHAFNNISLRQYFVARCLSSCVSNVFGS
jgi:hypothetical protein